MENNCNRFTPAEKTGFSAGKKGGRSIVSGEKRKCKGAMREKKKEYSSILGAEGASPNY